MAAKDETMRRKNGNKKARHNNLYECQASYSHVSAERYLEVRETSFLMHIPESTDTINDERVIDNGRLEALHSVPYRQADGQYFSPNRALRSKRDELCRR